MITFNQKPVRVISVDEDNICTVQPLSDPPHQEPNGAMFTVSAFRLKATGGASELSQVIASVKRQTKAIKQ